MNLFELIGVITTMVVGGGLVLWAITAVCEGMDRRVPSFEEDEHAEGLSAPWNRRKK